LVALPEARLLLLHEAVAFVVERCECGLEEAQRALLRAFREDTIAARARLPINYPGRHPSWPEELCDVDVYPEHWYVAVDWENDCLGVSRSVTVKRASLEQWLPKPTADPDGRTAAGDTSGSPVELAPDDPPVGIKAPASRHPKKRGPAGGQIAAVKAIVADVHAKKYTLDQLHGMKQDSLARQYGYRSRGPALKALETAATIVGNSNSDKR
jgi:hypothetical protein